MASKQVIPVEKENQEECNCCLEQKTLYSCGIDNCSWKICESCYRKIYQDNLKCPACRNCIEYKIFSPKISPIQEIHIDINNVEPGAITVREIDCCWFYLSRCRTPCCLFDRNAERRFRCKCRTFNSVTHFCLKALIYPLFKITVFLLLIFLCILIGRWVMWIVDPGFMSVYPYIFWLPVGWFILAGILGIVIISAVACCSSMMYCCLCNHSEDDW